MIYPVKDLAQAKVLYHTVLGVEPDVDEAYYVGFSVGGQHSWLDPNGHSNAMRGPVGYRQVQDINQSLGSSSTPAPWSLRGSRMSVGKLVASVTDADRNVIGLIREP